MNKKLDLDNHVPYFLTYISSKISHGASRIYRENYGIGITEWRIMGILGVHSLINANQVCTILGMDKAAVSRSIRKLEIMKIVRVSASVDDYRSKLLELTESGRELHDKILKIALDREEQLLSVLNVSEKESLIKILRKLRLSSSSMMV